MKINEKYKGLSREQLLEKVYQLGVDFERNSGSCSQCTVAALHEILGFEPVIVKIASTSCGGQAGCSTGTCGAILGGTIVLDYYLGRPAELLSMTHESQEAQDVLESAMETSMAFCKWFNDKYGSIHCSGVQELIYGRTYNLQDPADWDAFMADGAHTDPTKCMSVIGSAARWVLEMLLDKKILLKE